MTKFKSKILYVEDEDGIRTKLSRFLNRFASELFLASDGSEGLELYKKHNPDIVISDIKMPNMDGIEMVKKIKEINSEQAIIFTTAFSDTDFFINAIELQVYAYVLKPIELKKLQNKIEEITNNIHIKEDLKLKEKMLIQQSKMAAMGEMIGNIAHQWRQPLSVISTSASAIDYKIDNNLPLSEEELKTFAVNIVDQANYLSKTIDDFRDFFKSSDEILISSLKEFLTKSIDLTSSAFDNNYISVIKHIDENINVYGNSSQLIQAMVNILNNAKDALKNIKQDKKCVFVVTAKKENNNIIISIKDNAGGVPENIKERIFEPYFTTKSQNQGTGLGLYITYQIIVNNLNGTIHVENEEFEFENQKFKGANFIITLPIVEE